MFFFSNIYKVILLCDEMEVYFAFFFKMKKEFF